MATFTIHVVSSLSGEKLATVDLGAGQTVGELRCAVIRACFSEDPLADARLIFRQEMLNDSTKTVESVGLHDGADLEVVKFVDRVLVAVTAAEVSRWDGVDAEPLDKWTVELGCFRGLSSDGQCLWVDGELKSTANGQIIETVSRKRHDIILSPLASHGAFISGCDDDGLNLVDLRTGDHTMQRYCYGHSGMDFLNFSQDGQVLLVAHGFMNKLVRISSVGISGFEKRSGYDFDHQDNDDSDDDDRNEFKNFVMISHAGIDIVATVPLESDRTRVLRVLDGPIFDNAEGPACLCPKGHFLLASSKKKDAAMIFLVEDGRKVHSLPCSSPTAVAFAQDGRVVALGDRSGHVGIWSAQSGECLVSLSCSGSLLALGFASRVDVGAKDLSDSALNATQSKGGYETEPDSIAPILLSSATPKDLSHTVVQTTLSTDGLNIETLPNPMAPIIQRRCTKRVAVVVRTSVPTDAMLKRFVDWALALSDLDGVDFYVSIDTTRDKRSLQKIEHIFQSHGFTIQSMLHAYTETDLESAFPALAGLRSSIPIGVGDLSDLQRPLAKGFRCEALSLWRKSLQNGLSYSYTWVLEDDMGYSGSLADLIMSYSEEAADLISGPYLQDLGENSDIIKHVGWDSSHICTDAFTQRATKKFMTDEVLQRFSHELLDELDVWMHDGASAWSNQMSPSVCNTAGMAWQPLRQRDIGHAWAWNHRVSEDEWSRICKTAQNGLDHSRCFHALKF